MRKLDEKVIRLTGKVLGPEPTQIERQTTLRNLALGRMVAFAALVFALDQDVQLGMRIALAIFLLHAAFEAFGAHRAISDVPSLDAERRTATIFHENARWVRIGTLALSTGLMLLAVMWLALAIPFPDLGRTGFAFLFQGMGFGLLVAYWYVVCLEPRQTVRARSL